MFYKYLHYCIVESTGLEPERSVFVILSDRKILNPASTNSANSP